MIIVQLMGGLGNQLFQYAAARRLAIEKGTELKLDITGFDSNQVRQFKLNHFNISAGIASPSERSYFVGRGFSGRFFRRIEPRILPRQMRHLYFEETQYQLETDFLKTPLSVYLQGYFQNENYFKPIENTIRDEFKIVSPIDAENLAIAHSIQGVTAVSIHIRRGDYAMNVMTTAYHGLIPLEFYNQAVGLIAAQVKTPHFFVFSDDPVWAQENLKLDYPAYFVSRNGDDRDYIDLWLMSLCQHHIIANSSFSWWGAWLSNNPGKIIYAPRQWILLKNIDASFIVPNSWNTL